VTFSGDFRRRRVVRGCEARPVDRLADRFGAARLEMTVPVRRPLVLRLDDPDRLRDPARLVAAFFAGVDFFAVVFRAVGFFAADFRAVDFFAVDFFAGVAFVRPDEDRPAVDRREAARLARAARSRSDRVEVMVWPPPSPLPRRDGSVPAA
jgi:hypothetical protein